MNLLQDGRSVNLIICDCLVFLHCIWSRDCFVYYSGGGHSGRDRMLVGFTTISAFHFLSPLKL